MKRRISDWRCPSLPEHFRKRNSRCYLPLLVSIGPIFHGRPELKNVEDLKPEISKNFIQECMISSGNEVDTYKKKLYDVAIEMKPYYSEEIGRRFTDEKFYEMLLLDVCFAVAVIHGIVSKNERKLPLSSSVLRMCLRDFFLLENQIPFLLVQDLVKLRFGSTKIIHQFLSAVIHHPLTSNHMDKQPPHLLDLLRHEYIGIGQFPAQRSDSYCSNKVFSAKQLHDRGVRFWEAVSRKIGYSIVQLEFDANFGNLYMPPLLINESFESIFLNIAAYEASGCDLRKSEVTTYLCLLQHLARDPESVGVLRKNVIRTKEDNNSIVKMFQRMCENLQPSFQLYDRLLSELQFFPSGFIASIICWSRKPSTTHLVSRVFFTSAVLGTIIALADILSFLVNSNKAFDVGPSSSFQKDGLGRLDHRSRGAGGEGQPILASAWTPFAYKTPWDEPGEKARASSCLVPAEGFFAEDSLVGGMGPLAARGTPERCSIADECFLEEVSRYSLLKPSTVCVWGGRASSSSSPFSGMGGSLLEMEERCGHEVILKETEEGLSINPLSMRPAEERMGEKSTSGLFPLKDGRKEWGEEEDKDMESWNYSCMAKFCHCLGMPTEGCERDILKLLHKMRDRRDRSENLSGKKRKGQRTSRFDRELKKLEWSVNYSGSGGDRGNQECVT